MAQMVTGTIGIDASPAIDTLGKLGAAVDNFGERIKSKLSGGSVEIGTDKASAGLKDVATQAGTTTEAIKKVGSEGGKGLGQLPAVAQSVNKALGTMGDIAKQALGMFGGGLLLKGVDGLIGGFGELFEKGLAIKKMNTELEIGFRASGVAAGQVDAAMKASAKTVGELSDKYAVSKGALNQATAAFLKYGGTTDNLAQKQELIIGLAKKGGIEFEAAARMLAKATDPENEANLKRLGIVLDKNASETDRFAKIQSKLAGTLEVTADAARGPEGAIERLKNALGGFKGAIGSTLIEVLTPVFNAVSYLATVITKNVLPAFRSFIGAIKEGASFLGPIVPIVATLAAGLTVYTFATNAAFAASLKTFALEKMAAVQKFALSVATNAQTIATTAATGAMALFNAVMAANPIALAVIALTALVGGFVLLYKTVKPFREFIDGALSMMVPILSQVWDVVKVLGGAVLSLMLVPFQMVWTAIKSVWSIVSGLFSAFTGGAGSSGKALDTLRSALEKVSTFLTTLKAAFAGVQNTVRVFSEVFGTVIDRLIHFDLSGAKEAFSTAGAKLGQAFKDGASESLNESAFEKIKENVEKATDAQVTIRANIAASGDAGKLADDLTKVQDKMKPLEVKVKAGLASPKEREEFDKLATQAGDIGKKIAASVPEAVKGQREILTAAGKTVTVYDVQADAVKSIGDAQRKMYEGEAVQNQQKYSANVEKLTGLYEESKNTQADLFAQMQKTSDPKQLATLGERYSEVKKKTEEYGASLKDAYDKGRSGGLLTEQAFIKVLTAQGMNATEAKRFYEEQKKQAAEAEKVAGIIAKYAGAFDNAKKSADEMLSKANSDAANYAEGIRNAMAAGDKEGAATLRKLQKEALAQGDAAYRKSLELQRTEDANNSQKRYEKRAEFIARTREAEENALKIRRETLIAAQKFDVEQIKDEGAKKLAQIDLELQASLAAINEKEKANASARISDEARAEVAAALEMQTVEVMREASAKRIAVAEEEAKKRKAIEDTFTKGLIDAYSAREAQLKANADAIVPFDENSVRDKYNALRDVMTTEQERTAIVLEQQVREQGKVLGKSQEAIEADVQTALIRQAADYERKRTALAIDAANDRAMIVAASIEDEDERALAMKIAAIETARAKELQAQGLTEQQRAAIIKKADDEIATARFDAIAKKFQQVRDVVKSAVDEVNKLFEDDKKRSQEASAAYDTETAALLEQLRTREIGQKEYYERVDALRKKRERDERTSGTSLQRVAKMVTTSITKYAEAQSQKQITEATKAAESGQMQWGKLGEAAAYTYLGMIADGKSAAEATLATLIQTAQSTLDVLVPLIIAKYSADLGPIGTGLALAAVATVKGLLAAASSGFKDGGYTGDGSPNDVAGVTHKKEFVFREGITSRYKKQFDAIHGGANPFDVFASPKVAVVSAGGGTSEMSALREDLRNGLERLGGRITTRQSVVVTGAVDEKRFFKEIKAKERAMMRGR